MRIATFDNEAVTYQSRGMEIVLDTQSRGQHWKGQLAYDARYVTEEEAVFASELEQAAFVRASVSFELNGRTFSNVLMTHVSRTVSS